jgi:hypothetical protein
MTRLDEYYRTKHNFSKINDTLWPILEGMTDEKSKLIHRVNDTMLILLSIFAFEAVCWDCIADVRKKKPPAASTILLIPALQKTLAACGAPEEMVRDVNRLYALMNIRHLYVHGAGRRRGLTDPKCLPARTLRHYGFEADECEGCPDRCADKCDACSRTNEDTQWWPLRSLCGQPGAFSKCVCVLDELMPLIVKNLAGDSK